MPLRLITSRNSKRRTFISGGHTSVSLWTKAAELTDDRSLSILKQIERNRGGEYHLRAESRSLDISKAAVAYLEAGRRKRYVATLIKHFGETPLSEIDQAAIDKPPLHCIQMPGTARAMLQSIRRYRPSCITLGRHQD